MTRRHACRRDVKWGFLQSVTPANTRADTRGTRIPSRAGTGRGRRWIISFDSAARRCAPVEVHARPDRLRPWTPYSSMPRATTATIGCTSYEPATPTAFRTNRIPRALKSQHDKGYTESTTPWRAPTSLKQATINRLGNNRHEGNQRASGANACYRHPSCRQD